MNQLNLKALTRRKRYQSYKGKIGRVAPNHLNREFFASQPNQKWVTDVTEFNVLGQKLYLSPILDLYNSEIIAYQLSKQPMYSLVDKMLLKAFRRLKPKTSDLIIHSDQGWQYQMTTYQKRLQKRGIIQSMSRKGNCLDNAVMENFFGLLKSELFYLQKFKSVEALASSIKEYIYYYNHHRIKLKLKGLSPVQYRNQFLLTA